MRLKCRSAGCEQRAILGAAGVPLRALGPGGESWHPGTVAPAPVVRPAPVRPPMALPPDLAAPAEDDLRAIVAARRWPGPEGLRLAAARGVLRAGTHLGHRAWALVDDLRAGQARRMDGHPWRPGAKVVSFRGTDGHWPIGLGAIRSTDRLVMLCEGAPDTLAALWFAVAEGAGEWAWAACMAGVGMIPSPDACAILRRVPRVLIVLQSDDAAAPVVARWQAAFRRDVESWHPGTLLAPGQGKDLADVLARPDLIEGHLAPASRTRKAPAPEWTLTGEDVEP